MPNFHDRRLYPRKPIYSVILGLDVHGPGVSLKQPRLRSFSCSDFQSIFLPADADSIPIHPPQHLF